MRVLSVGNMYPPHHLGGYELVWRSATEHVRARGHEVTVLTTDHRLPGVEAGDEPGVRRELRWYWRDHGWPKFSFGERLAVERHNARVFAAALEDTKPDVVAFWAMGGMSLSLVERVRRLGLPAVGFVHDDWMLYGPRVDKWLRMAGIGGARVRAAERLTKIPTNVELAGAARWLFVGEFTRERAQASAGEDTGVAHSGVDEVFLTAEPEQPWRWRLLYSGRLDPRKGMATAVEALALLPAGARLVVAGAGDPGELADDERVELAGALDRAGAARRLRRLRRSRLPRHLGRAVGPRAAGGDGRRAAGRGDGPRRVGRVPALVGELSAVHAGRREPARGCIAASGRRRRAARDAALGRAADGRRAHRRRVQRARRSGALDRRQPLKACSTRWRTRKSRARMSKRPFSSTRSNPAVQAKRFQVRAEGNQKTTACSRSAR